MSIPFGLRGFFPVLDARRSYMKVGVTDGPIRVSFGFYACLLLSSAPVFRALVPGLYRVQAGTMYQLPVAVGTW